MAAYGITDQVSGQGAVHDLPNFVGELFRLSPVEAPLLTLIGGLTGGMGVTAPVFTWQDTLHRAGALQAVAEGADATFSSQKRNEKKNVTAIHQYGVEITYTKQASTGLLGSGGTTPTVAATSILGGQPVMDEMGFQTQIKIEQAALDVEIMFLTGTYSWPNAGTARQTQGIIGAVAAATTTDYVADTGRTADRGVINDLAKKAYDEGAKLVNPILMTNSLGKVEIGDDYAVNSTGGWNLQPRSYNVFGVNVTDLETEFVRLPVVLNRHLDEDTILLLDLAQMAPCFLPSRGGHFFLEPLAKSGSYDRLQLYGDIGLKYGPAGWHAKAINLHA